MAANSSTPRPAVAVVSQLWLGHMPAYHRLLASSLSRIGCDVVNLSPEPIEDGAWHAFGSVPAYPLARTTDARAGSAASMLRNRVRNFLEPTGLLAARRARRNWRALGARLADLQENIGMVALTYLADGFLVPWISARWVDSVMPVPWFGIWNAPPAGNISLSPARRTHAPLAAQTCAGVLVPDAGLTEGLSRLLPHRRILAMPEVADLRVDELPREEIAGIRAAAEGRPIVALLGNIHRRKGIFTFFELARKAWDDGARLFFVAAGEASPTSTGSDLETILALARDAPPNVRFIGCRLDDGPEFNSFVRASDVLFCAYWDFPFNSNLLTKAASFRKPVIVSSGFLMEKLVAQYDLGLAVPQKDASAALAALCRIVEPLNHVDAGRRIRGFEEFTRKNSAERLDSVLRDLLERSETAASGQCPTPLSH